MKPRFKFALFGRKSSGKTCYLAALSIPHTTTCDCTITRVPLPEDKKDDVVWERSKNRLNEAVNQILSGKKPDATQLAWGIQESYYKKYYEPDHFLFRLETSDRESYDIEFIDYAGELINPDITYDQLVADLRNTMKTMDALFVLIEAPKIGEEDPNKTSIEVMKLIQALQTIEKDTNTNTRFNTPLALLITKCDRLLPKYNDLYQNQEIRITEFLNSPDGELIKLCYATINNISQDGFCKIFPVSAFGESKIDENQNEVPVVANPLKSFGLEEPLIWAARLIVNKKIQECQNKLENVSILKPWSLFLPYSEIISRSQELLKLVGSKHRPIVDAILQKARRARKYFYGMCLITILFLFMLVELFVFSIQYARINYNLKNPKIADQTLLKYAEWLNYYCQSPFFRYIIPKLYLLPVDKASNLAINILSQVEERYWDAVLKAQNVNQKFQLLKQYISVFPKGVYSKQANEEYLKLSAEIHKLELLNKFENAKLDIEKIKNDPSVSSEKFEELLYTLNQISSAAKRLQLDALSNDVKNECNKLLLLYKEFQEKASEKLWSAVLGAKSLEEKIKLIEEYITLFPNGVYAKKAHEELQLLRIEKIKIDIINQLEKINVQLFDIEKFPENAPLEKVDELIENINQIRESAKFIQDDELHNKIKVYTDKVTIVKAKCQFAKFNVFINETINQIDTLLSDQDNIKGWEEALKLILKLCGNYNSIPSETQNGLKKALGVSLNKLITNIEVKVKNYIKLHYYDEALFFVRKFLDSPVLKQISETKVLASDTYYNALKDFEVSIIDAETNYLIETLKEFSSKNVVEIYKEKKKILSMIDRLGNFNENVLKNKIDPQKLVNFENFVRDLDIEKKKVNFKIKISGVEWIESSWVHYEYKINLNINGFNLNTNISNHSKNTSLINRVVNLYERYIDQLEIKIIVKYEGLLNDKKYLGEDNISLLDLLSKQVVKVDIIEENKYVRGKLVLELLN